MIASPFIYSPPETDPLPVLYEDEAILVVDKPAGLLSVPGRLEEHKDSLFLRLEAVYPDVLTVHRLDMSTSGLMVFARGKSAHRALSKAFEARSVEKRYTALVHGEPDTRSGEIDLPLIKDWPNRPRQKVDFEIGKPSKTLWRMIEGNADTSLVELVPVTGRTHQLRLHMAAIGHPILGDEFYGTPESMNAAPRLCLHASALSFTHPVSTEPMEFASEPGFLG